MSQGKSNTPKTIRDQLIAIQKLYNDALQAGRDHEADAALGMLEKLAAKHKISTQSLLEPEREWFTFIYRSKWEYTILLCLAIKVTGDKDVGVYDVPRSRIKVEIKLSKAEELDLRVLFRYYKPLFESELNLLIGAFVNKNGFAVPRDEDEPPPKTTDRTMKIQMMMELMKRHPSPLNAGYLEAGGA